MPPLPRGAEGVCPSCHKLVGDPTGEDWNMLFAHIDACKSDKARRLALAHPEWPQQVAAVLLNPPSLVKEFKGTAPPVIPPEPADATLFTCDDASEVVPGVYLGNITVGMDVDWLRTHGIKAVVNCVELHKADKRKEADPLSPSQLAAAGIAPAQYTCLDMDDGKQPGYTEVRVAEGAAAVAAAWQAGLPVLVHCAVGASRSATVLIAFLVKHFGRADGSSGSAGSAAGSSDAPSPADAGASSIPQAQPTPLTLAEALVLAKRRRPHVYPNLAFLTHLLEVEAEVMRAAGATAGGSGASPAASASAPAPAAFTSSIPAEMLVLHREKL